MNKTIDLARAVITNNVSTINKDDYIKFLTDQARHNYNRCDESNDPDENAKHTIIAGVQYRLLNKVMGMTKKEWKSFDLNREMFKTFDELTQGV